MRRDQLWLVPLGVVVFVSCMRAAEHEPYDYTDDDDAGMFPAGGELDDEEYQNPLGDVHMDGTWVGRCDLELYGYYIYTFDLRLEIETNADGELEGHGDLSLYGSSYGGPLEGSYDGEEAEVSWVSDSYGYAVDVNLEGPVEDDVFSGTCRVVGYYGDFEVERTGD